MLLELNKALILLPNLLRDATIWHGVRITYEKPYVDRLWTQLDNNRLYLHSIEPCNAGEEFLHKHPWPSAVKVVLGKYEMKIGYSENDVTPSIAATVLMTKDSCYEMINPNGWHSVRPINDKSLSVMVAGKPWIKKESDSVTVLTEEMTEERKKGMLSLFRLIFWASEVKKQ